MKTWWRIWPEEINYARSYLRHSEKARNREQGSSCQGKDLGISAARVPSSSLDKITAEYLESYLTPAKPSVVESSPPVPAPPPEPIRIVSAPPEPVLPPPVIEISAAPAPPPVAETKLAMPEIGAPAAPSGPASPPLPPEEEVAEIDAPFHRQPHPRLHLLRRGRASAIWWAASISRSGRPPEVQRRSRRLVLKVPRESSRNRPSPA